MKTMTCQQLGGACNQRFRASSFDEIARMSRQHATEMLELKDAAHLRAMSEMQELMKRPEAMKEWVANRKKEFESLPEE